MPGQVINRRRSNENKNPLADRVFWKKAEDRGFAGIHCRKPGDCGPGGGLGHGFRDRNGLKSSVEVVRRERLSTGFDGDERPFASGLSVP